MVEELGGVSVHLLGAVPLDIIILDLAAVIDEALGQRLTIWAQRPRWWNRGHRTERSAGKKRAWPPASGFPHCCGSVRQHRSSLRGGAPDMARRQTGAGKQHSGAAATSPARNAPDPAGGAPKTVISGFLPACVKPHFRAKNPPSLIPSCIRLFAHCPVYVWAATRARRVPRRARKTAAAVAVERHVASHAMRASASR